MSENLLISALSLILMLVTGWCGWLTSQIAKSEDALELKIGTIDKSIAKELSDLRFIHMAHLLNEINKINTEQVRLRTQFDTIFNSLGDGLMKFFHRDDNSFAMDEIIDEIKKRLDAESVKMVSDYEKHADLNVDGWMKLKLKCEKVLKNQKEPNEQTAINFMAYLFCIHKLAATVKGLEAMRVSNE